MAFSWRSLLAAEKADEIVMNSLCFSFSLFWLNQETETLVLQHKHFFFFGFLFLFVFLFNFKDRACRTVTPEDFTETLVLRKESKSHIST